MAADIRSLAPTAVMFTVFGGVMLYSMIYACYRLYKNYDQYEGTSTPVNYFPPPPWFSYRHSLSSTVHPLGINNLENGIQPQSYPMIIIDSDQPPSYWQLCPMKMGQEKKESSNTNTVDPETPPPSYEEAVVFNIQKLMNEPNPVKITSPLTEVDISRYKSDS